MGPARDPGADRRVPLRLQLALTLQLVGAMLAGATHSPNLAARVPTIVGTLAGLMLLTSACGASHRADADAGASLDGATESDAALDDARVPPPDAATYACDYGDPRAPAGGVLWAAPLAGTGGDTLGGHGHDDGFGAVGYCAGTPVAGQPFYRLIAAGFETDDDVDGDQQQATALGVDFWRDANAFTGYGESAGRVNVYLQVVDEAGAVLTRDSAPGIVYVREIHDGDSLDIPIDAKPASEFQTNFPMTGGAVRFGASVKGASDRVINLRLPVNHHVTYALVFRRESP